MTININDLQYIIKEHGIDEYCIKVFDGKNLLLLGSKNISYYHQLEMKFINVDYINCPINFWSSIPVRMATIEERNKYKKQTQLEDEDLMVILEDDFGDIYFVICEKFEYKFVDAVKNPNLKL